MTYLPDSLETVRGQDIMLDEFGMGAFSMVIVEDMEPKDVVKLKDEIREINHVKDVLWYDSVMDISVPVKEYAVSQGLRILQPEKLKDEAFIEELRSLQADLQIVVAFRMLPEIVWNMPRLGTFNLHASLLPQYRGAAPINWAVINGDTETGITTFFLKHEIDTGEIIQQVRVPIADTDNVEIVHDKLMIARLLLEELKVDRVEVASARVSEGEFDAVKMICDWAARRNLLPRVEVLGFVDGHTSVDWIHATGCRVKIGRASCRERVSNFV